MGFSVYQSLVNNVYDQPHFSMCIHWRFIFLFTLKPTPKLAALYKESMQETLCFDVDMCPTIVPPMPWLSAKTGGYLMQKSNVYDQAVDRLISWFGTRWDDCCIDWLIDWSIHWLVNAKFIRLIDWASSYSRPYTSPGLGAGPWLRGRHRPIQATFSRSGHVKSTRSLALDCK